MNRVVLLATARTGSNLLVDTLNKHPALYFHGELFHRARVNGFRAYKAVEALGVDPTELRDRDHLRFLDLVFEYSVGVGRVAAGFKLFLNHSNVVLKHVIENDAYRLIVLERQNFLASYSSMLIGQATGIWHSRDGEVETTPPITFDPAAFENYRRSIESSYATLRQRVVGRPNVFDIEYRQLSNPPVVSRLVEFLGAEGGASLSPELRKQNSSDIVGRFDNPAEVLAYLEREGLLSWKEE